MPFYSLNNERYRLKAKEKGRDIKYLRSKREIK